MQTRSDLESCYKQLTLNDLAQTNRDLTQKKRPLPRTAPAQYKTKASAVTLAAPAGERGLIHSDGVGMPLTESGSSYALRVIRSHRLQERYLADRTSEGAADWHDAAERREHTLTPTAVAESTETLTQLRLGESAKIVRISPRARERNGTGSGEIR